MIVIIVIVEVVVVVVVVVLIVVLIVVVVIVEVVVVVVVVEMSIRHYFYTIDIKGYLYISTTTTKNFVSCLKDKAILLFMYKQLRLNNTQQYNDYKYISPCGKEINYIKHDDDNACIGFTSFDKDKLYYAGDQISTVFNPSSIVINKTNGRIYHPVSGHKYLSDHYGLLHSNIASELSNHINIITNSDNNDIYQLQWKSKTYDIKSI